ncbi:unnamed protein product [Trichogramma brassicae]|uniref:Uncharacterized protein n=1 Tax=Trichogramma brassicae TaxID=86971 RepID=A0A6H5ICF5_9HYME|nr:unnamed protein product [Trichogramma brassicae]
MADLGEGQREHRNSHYLSKNKFLRSNWRHLARADNLIIPPKPPFHRKSMYTVKSCVELRSRRDIRKGTKVMSAE